MSGYNIFKEPKGKEYVKFINYLCDNCEYFSFDIKTRIASEERHIKEFNKMCLLLNVNKEEAIKNYNNKDFIDDAYIKLKDLKGIIINWTNPYIGVDLNEYNITKEEYEKTKQEWIKNDIKNILFYGAGKKIYEENIKKIEEYLKEEYIKEEYNNDSFSKLKELNIVLSQKEMSYMERYKTCYYKISDKSKKLLLSRRRLYNMLFPDFPENIAFYKEGKSWLGTTTHENDAWIDIKNKNELKYIKNIGLKITKEIGYIIDEEIDKWDPIGKYSVKKEKREIDDTYRTETSRIYSKIDEKSKVNKIKNAIYKVFIDMYDELYDEKYIEMYNKNISNNINKFKQECKIVAEKIYLRINE